MPEYNFTFNWARITTLGKVQNVLMPIVGAPSQAQVTQAVADYIEAHPGSLSPLSAATKAALLQIAEKVAYIDENGESYYNALDAALNARALLQITAVYTQSGTVYTTDSLDSLKADLVVTAYYDDGTTADVTAAATLSGTLTVGTSTITATYSGKSATFDVTVTEHTIEGWYYPFNGSIVSAGSKDFGFTGVENYATGVDGQAYYHKTEGSSSTDVIGIKATGLIDIPDLSGDWTISFWHKSTDNLRGHHFAATNYVGSGSTTKYKDVGNIKSGWTVTNAALSKNMMGILIDYESQTLKVKLANTAGTYGSVYTLTPPSSFDSTNWHHYALTQNRTTGFIYFFIDGEIIFTLETTTTLSFGANLCLGNLFGTTSATQSTPLAGAYGDYVDDLYIIESCKWTSDFDPMTIVY